MNATEKVADLFFDPTGTYIACDAEGRKMSGESLDVPAWIVAVVKEKLGRSAVDQNTKVYVPYGQTMTVAEILRRHP